MIKNDDELEGTLDRINRFWRMVISMRQAETKESVYRLSAGGFLAEIDRMNLEVREYLSLHPSEIERENERIAA